MYYYIHIYIWKNLLSCLTVFLIICQDSGFGSMTVNRGTTVLAVWIGVLSCWKKKNLAFSQKK